MSRHGGAYCFRRVRSQRKSVDWGIMGPALAGAYECYAHISSFIVEQSSTVSKWKVRKPAHREHWRTKTKPLPRVLIFLCPPLIGFTPWSVQDTLPPAAASTSLSADRRFFFRRLDGWRKKSRDPTRGGTERNETKRSALEQFR